MVLRLRPSHHKNADIREALPATLHCLPRRSFHDHLRQYGRSSQVLEWFLSITQHWVAQSKGYRLTVSLFLISFSCWERDEEVEKGDGDRKKKPKRHRSVALSVDVDHAGVGMLDQSPRTSRMSVNTKMEHRTLAWVLVTTGTRVHLSESVSRKDSDRERKYSKSKRLFCLLWKLRTSRFRNFRWCPSPWPFHNAFFFWKSPT